MANKTFVNKKAVWFIKLVNFLKQLDQGEVKLPLIAKEQFESIDSKSQIKMLKSMLIVTLKNINIDINKNMPCFQHLDNSPSMTINKEKYDLHCFSCQDLGKTLDIFDLLEIIFNLGTFPKQKQKAIELFVEDGKEIVQAMQVNLSKKNSYQRKMDTPNSAAKVFSASTNTRIYINAWEDKECLDYLKSRGLSEAIAKQFNLKCWDYKANKYVVIPCAEGYCVRRKFKDGIGTYAKFWNKSGVPITMFNDNAFNVVDNNGTILIFESAIDALTAAQISKNLNLDINVVAINGIENYQLLFQKLDFIKRKKLNLAILFDNDSAGASASIKICRELIEKQTYCYGHLYEKAGFGSFLSDFKDLNEAFISNSDKASKALEEIYNLVSGAYSDPFITAPSKLSESSEEKKNMFSSQNAISILESFGLSKIITDIK